MESQQALCCWPASQEDPKQDAATRAAAADLSAEQGMSPNPFKVTDNALYYSAEPVHPAAQSVVNPAQTISTTADLEANTAQTISPTADLGVPKAQTISTTAEVDATTAQMLGAPAEQLNAVWTGF